jgi:hypothetical protein
MLAPLPVTSRDELGDLARRAQRVAGGGGGGRGHGESRDTLARLLEEADRPGAGAREGSSPTQSNAEAFEGAYARLLHGFNDAQAAARAPVLAALQTLERVAAHDLSDR